MKPRPHPSKSPTVYQSSYHLTLYYEISTTVMWLLMCFNANYMKCRRNNYPTSHDSPVNVVNWLLAGRERNRGSIPNPHLQWVPGARSPRVEQPWCKSCPLKSSADVKNEWNHTSTPPPALMACAETVLFCYSDITICELFGSVCNTLSLSLVHSSQKYGCGARCKHASKLKECWIFNVCCIGLHILRTPFVVLIAGYTIV